MLFRSNYLMSPPLVVAYALAGSMNINVATESLGEGKNGKPVYLKDIWPTEQEVSAEITAHVKKELFEREYGKVFEGDQLWKNISSPAGDRFRWDSNSTYIRRAQFL